VLGGGNKDPAWVVNVTSFSRIEKKRGPSCAVDLFLLPYGGVNTLAGEMRARGT